MKPAKRCVNGHWLCDKHSTVCKVCNKFIRVTDYGELVDHSQTQCLFYVMRAEFNTLKEDNVSLKEEIQELKKMLKVVRSCSSQ